MNEKMNKKPVIVSNGKISKLNKVLLNSNTFKESWLQEVLYNEPSLLPTNEIDSSFANLIPIGREIPVDSGFIDNFYISSKGYLVIVETKLWRNPESRREVVGQILDYAKDVQNFDYEDLNNIYKQNHNNKNLFDEFVNRNYYSKDDEASFIDIVSKNISTARFLLMIVGDGIREGVEKMVSFLNSNPTMQYRFALCELEVYNLPNGERLVIPNLTLKTKIVERGVLRVENNNITYVNNEIEDKKQSSSDRSKYSSANYLSLDEWIEKKLNNKKLENKIRDFIQDIEDSNMIYTIGTSDLNIKLKLPQYNKKMGVFMLFGGGQFVGFQPSEFYNYLETYNYSKSFADELLEGLKKYLSDNNKHKPYENIKGYYYIDLEVFLNNKDDVLSLVEKFIANL